MNDHSESDVHGIFANVGNVFEGEVFNHFEAVHPDDITKLIQSSSNKSCELDPIPTSLLKECCDVLVPSITYFINSSLRSGQVPRVFKEAIVRPLLKKSDLDSDILKNYRPVSNLPFLSKLLERIVLRQLIVHLQKNNLQDAFQSAYRMAYSTETALVKVIDDLLNVIDNKGTTTLNLLDLSSAFDTIDHTILVNRLQHMYGIGGTVLGWLKSYLTNRVQAISIGQTRSDRRELKFGVPQGSVLGPVLFVLYTQPLAYIIRNYGLNYHMYADDIQIYSTSPVDSVDEKTRQVEECIGEVKQWMGQNKLKLNTEKTEALKIASRQKAAEFTKTAMMVGDDEVNFSDHVKNLGVILDSELKMDRQINGLKSKICFLLRKIGSIRQYITQEACARLVTATIFSSMDYCNSVLFGATAERLRKLQVIQNHAARLVLRKKRRDDPEPLLQQLHWLPVQKRVEFKAAVMMYKCKHNCAPAYLSELVQSHDCGGRNLRSKNRDLYVLPLTSSKAGDRRFSYFGPKTWNSLPVDIKNCDSLEAFKKKLKTHYFQSL